MSINLITYNTIIEPFKEILGLLSIFLILLIIFLIILWKKLKYRYKGGLISWILILILWISFMLNNTHTLRDVYYFSPVDDLVLFFLSGGSNIINNLCDCLSIYFALIFPLIIYGLVGYFIGYSMEKKEKDIKKWFKNNKVVWIAGLVGFIYGLISLVPLTEIRVISIAPAAIIFTIIYDCSSDIFGIGRCIRIVTEVLIYFIPFMYLLFGVLIGLIIKKNKKVLFILILFVLFTITIGIINYNEEIGDSLGLYECIDYNQCSSIERCVDHKCQELICGINEKAVNHVCCGPEIECISEGDCEFYEDCINCKCISVPLY